MYSRKLFTFFVTFCFLSSNFVFADEMFDEEGGSGSNEVINEDVIDSKTGSIIENEKESAIKEGACVKQNFLVSAYYSPLKGQKYYIRGSFEKDVYLNGNGTNGADGTDVYMGLLAAPRGYPYGTKIILPGLGVGTVHDRGGAIIEKSNYDRIDVWMGKGEPGLSRALNWGMRFIEGERCGKEVVLKDTLDYTKIASVLPEEVENRLIAKTKEDYYGFFQKNSSDFLKKNEFKYVNLPANLKEGDKGENVIKLQMILSNLGFYNASVLTGIYDVDTMEAVYQFQRENDVISSDMSVGVGQFGEKTKQALENFLAELHNKMKYINSSKSGEIIAGKNNYSDDIIFTKTGSNKSLDLPQSKSELMSSSKIMTIAQIQEMLKNKRAEFIQNSSTFADSKPVKFLP